MDKQKESGKNNGNQEKAELQKEYSKKEKKYRVRKLAEKKEMQYLREKEL